MSKAIIMKYKVQVIRTDEYEIEIDENVWNETELKDWSSIFWKVSSTEDVAKNFAIAFMRNEDRYFIEGYGYVKEYLKNGTLRSVPYHDEKGNYMELPEEKYSKGISITAISQDDEYETEISQITSK